MNRAAALLAILVAEAAIGYPRRWPHPVQAAGMLIAWAELRWNRGVPARQRAGGIALALTLLAAGGGVGWLAAHLLPGAAGTVLAILVGTSGLAQRSLHDHVRAVARPLRAGDLAGARTAVAAIVGRDVERLGPSGIATAAIESLAESFCDGVVMPALWFLVAGLPGLFAAKAINTADSMVGHLTSRLAAFGWASARLDDVIAWVPARIAGALLCVAGGGGWRVMAREARRHASPNAGWPEAAMAGALGRRLGGPVAYDGEPAVRPPLGDGPMPGAVDLDRALAIYRRACLLLWACVGGFAWLR